MKAVTMVVFVDSDDDEFSFEAAYNQIADEQPNLIFIDDYEGPLPTEESRKFFVGWLAGKAYRDQFKDEGR